MHLQQGFIVSRCPDISWAKLETGAALLDVRTPRLIRLNRSAATIWDVIEKPMSVDEVCDQIGSVFREQPDTLRSQVTNFVCLLVDAKLLVSHRADP